jgi:hypothetical protein
MPPDWYRETRLYCGMSRWLYGSWARSRGQGSHEPVLHYPTRSCCAVTQIHHVMSCLLETRSNSALLITDRLQGQSAWRANGPNIPHWWLAEETAIFAIELAGALVPDLKCRTGGVQTIYEHAFPRCMQPKLLLILKRTHGGQRPEMVVQCGDAHARDFCEIFHS